MSTKEVYLQVGHGSVSYTKIAWSSKEDFFREKWICKAHEEKGELRWLKRRRMKFRIPKREAALENFPPHTTMSHSHSDTIVQAFGARHIILEIKGILNRSTRGEQIWNPILEGRYTVGKVVRMSEWMKEGVSRDWKMLADDEKARVEGEIRLRKIRWFLDNPIVDLQDYRPNGIWVLPAPYFIWIDAVSPLFRTSELLACHKTLIEAP